MCLTYNSFGPFHVKYLLVNHIYRILMHATRRMIVMSDFSIFFETLRINYKYFELFNSSIVKKDASSKDIKRDKRAQYCQIFSCYILQPFSEILYIISILYVISISRKLSTQRSFCNMSRFLFSIVFFSLKSRE